VSVVQPYLGWAWIGLLAAGWAVLTTARRLEERQTRPPGWPHHPAPK
jgi:hypothetical protein